MSTRTTAKASWAVGNTIVVVAALVPVLWLASLSFKDPSTIADGSFLPHRWTLANYRGIFQTSLFTRALVNSIGIAVSPPSWPWSSGRWPPTQSPACASRARACWWQRPC